MYYLKLKSPLVNEQLKQLYVELEVNGAPKTLFFEDETSSSSGGDECLISVGVGNLFLITYKL